MSGEMASCSLTWLVGAGIRAMPERLWEAKAKLDRYGGR
jgi:hypothetical protein